MAEGEAEVISLAEAARLLGLTSDAVRKQVGRRFTAASGEGPLRLLAEEVLEERSLLLAKLGATEPSDGPLPDPRVPALEAEVRRLKFVLTQLNATLDEVKAMSEISANAGASVQLAGLRAISPLQAALLDGVMPTDGGELLDR